MRFGEQIHQFAILADELLFVNTLALFTEYAETQDTDNVHAWRNPAFLDRSQTATELTGPSFEATCRIQLCPWHSDIGIIFFLALVIPKLKSRSVLPLNMIL